MLEPFLMLTVLNCFFMFSSTVTTCALWWQHRRHSHSCSSHGDEPTKIKVRKSKNHENETLQDDARKFEGDNGDNGKISLKKREKSNSKSSKESKRDNKKRKSSGSPTNLESKEAIEEEEAPTTLEKVTSTKDIPPRATSPSSEARSTIVMEVSTVQKLVQIIDNNRDNQHVRLPKESVTYRFSPPENERKVEFVIQNKSEERS